MILGEDKQIIHIESLTAKPIRLSGAASEMLFSPDADKLLVHTMMGLDIISVGVQNVLLTSRKLAMPRMKWVINHPLNSALLLAFGCNTIHVFDFPIITSQQDFIFINSDRANFFELAATNDIGTSPTSSQVKDLNRRNPSQVTSRLWVSKDAVERVVVTLDRSHVLVQISSSISKYKIRSGSSCSILQSF